MSSESRSIGGADFHNHNHGEHPQQQHANKTMDKTTNKQKHQHRSNTQESRQKVHPNPSDNTNNTIAPHATHTTSQGGLGTNCTTTTSNNIANTPNNIHIFQTAIQKILTRKQSNSTPNVAMLHGDTEEDDGSNPNIKIKGKSKGKQHNQADEEESSRSGCSRSVGAIVKESVESSKVGENNGESQKKKKKMKKSKKTSAVMKKLQRPFKRRSTAPEEVQCWNPYLGDFDLRDLNPVIPNDATALVIDDGAFGDATTVSDAEESAVATVGSVSNETTSRVEGFSQEDAASNFNAVLDDNINDTKTSISTIANERPKFRPPVVQYSNSEDIMDEMREMWQVEESVEQQHRHEHQENQEVALVELHSEPEGNTRRSSSTNYHHDDTALDLVQAYDNQEAETAPNAQREEGDSYDNDGNSASEDITSDDEDFARAIAAAVRASHDHDYNLATAAAASFVNQNEPPLAPAENHHLEVNEHGEVIIGMTMQLKSEPRRPTRRSSSTNYHYSESVTSTCRVLAEDNYSYNNNAGGENGALIIKAECPVGTGGSTSSASNNGVTNHILGHGEVVIDGIIQLNDEAGENDVDISIQDKNTRRRSSTFLFKRSMQEREENDFEGGGTTSQYVASGRASSGDFVGATTDLGDEVANICIDASAHGADFYYDSDKIPTKSADVGFENEQGYQGEMLLEQGENKEKNDSEHGSATQKEPQPTRKPARRMSLEFLLKNKNKKSSPVSSGTSDSSENVRAYLSEYHESNYHSRTPRVKTNMDSHGTIQTEMMTSTSSDLSYQNPLNSIVSSPRQQKPSATQVMISLIQGTMPGCSNGVIAPVGEFRSQNFKEVSVISEEDVLQGKSDSDSNNSSERRQRRRRQRHRNSNDSIHLSGNDWDSVFSLASSTCFDSNGNIKIDHELSVGSLMVDSDEDEECQRQKQKDGPFTTRSGSGGLTEVGGGFRTRRRVSNFLFKRAGSHGAQTSLGADEGSSDDIGTPTSPSSVKPCPADSTEKKVDDGKVAGVGCANSRVKARVEKRRSIEENRLQKGPNPFAFF